MTWTRVKPFHSPYWDICHRLPRALWSFDIYQCFYHLVNHFRKFSRRLPFYREWAAFSHNMRMGKYYFPTAWCSAACFSLIYEHLGVKGMSLSHKTKQIILSTVLNASMAYMTSCIIVFFKLAYGTYGYFIHLSLHSTWRRSDIKKPSLRISSPPQNCG